MHNKLLTKANYLILCSFNQNNLSTSLQFVMLQCFALVSFPEEIFITVYGENSQLSHTWVGIQRLFFHCISEIFHAFPKYIKRIIIDVITK